MENSQRVVASSEPVPVPPSVPTGYHRWWSRALHQDCEVQLHGRSGPILIAFPPSGGRFFDFDHNGMLASAKVHLESGSLRLVCLDSPDASGWENTALPAARRAAQADAFDSMVVAELLPWLRAELNPAGPFGTVGCSLGALHAANLLFRHPDLFESALCLSGRYDLDGIMGGFDPSAYFHSPLHYLPNLSDPWFLDRIRRARLVFAAGQGSGEEASADEARRMGSVLAGLEIPAWIDLWGGDVTHDWHWWGRMLTYFLGARPPAF
jgi:esterase/lipase superfamily enzyme